MWYKKIPRKTELYSLGLRIVLEFSSLLIIFILTSFLPRCFKIKMSFDYCIRWRRSNKVHNYYQISVCVHKLNIWILKESTWCFTTLRDFFVLDSTRLVFSRFEQDETSFSIQDLFSSHGIRNYNHDFYILCFFKKPSFILKFEFIQIIYRF